jgi:hypothetical protein
MAIDPKQMTAWANEGQEPPAKKGQAHPPQGAKGGKQPKPKEDDQEQEEGGEEEEEESEEEASAEGDLEEKYPTLFQKLEGDGGSTFEEAAGLVDREALVAQDDLPPEEQDMLVEAINDLPGDLTETIKTEAHEISWEDAMEIAHALEAGEHVEDPELVGAFLFHVSRAA